MASRSSVITSAVFILSFVLAGGNASAESTSCDNRPFCIGTEVSEDTYAAWDITILPNGANLPDGKGNAYQGAEVYQEHCEACHGPGGRGGIKVDADHASYPALVAGPEATPLTSLDAWPSKTIGTYWPYATSVFDYIHRAMPLMDAQSLTSDDTYALVAYLLSENGIVQRDEEMDKTTLAAVQMPNRDGFVCDARPDVTNPRCMADCPLVGEPNFLLDVATGRQPSDENCLILKSE